MSFFDFHRVIKKPAEKSLQRISVLNPLTIHKKGTRAKAVFALALVCFFWGTTWIANKEAVRHMPPLQMAGLRQLAAGSCYFLYFIYRGSRLPRKVEWRAILILSFLNFLVANGLSTWGLKYISAGLGAIIGAIFPLWLVVIGFFASKTKIPTKALIGLILGFAGVCIIFYEHLPGFFLADFRFGIIISLIATWGWAFGTLYTKRHAASFNPYFSIGLQMLISGIALTAISHVRGTAVSITTIPWQAWASISYLVLFGSVLTFSAYLYALQNLSTGQTSLYAYINPMVAILLGWMIYDEKLTIFIGLGGAIALLGVYLVNKAYKVPVTSLPESEGI